ncbi:MAG: nucleoside/nucleotide kinase family protein [Ornithinibacter sp.]
MQTLTSITDLTERVLATLQDLGAQRRVVVGLVGEPGSGKSTVAQALAEDLGSHGAVTTVVPMDGFHLANVELARLGLAARKGAPDTFDALGYAALLHRLRTSTDETVYAPAFERSIEEAVAGSIPVLSETSVVVTEGNYLLVSEGLWARVAPLLDLSCALHVDDGSRSDWLRARHVRFGRSEEEAAAWVEAVDEPNAALVRSTMPRADVALRLG